MPIFTYECSCGKVFDEYRHISERDVVPVCHGKTVRVIVAPSLVMGDIAPYRSMVDGSMIMGRRQHREHLREHRLIEVGDQQHHLKPYGTYKPTGTKDAVISAVKQVLNKD